MSKVGERFNTGVAANIMVRRDDSASRIGNIVRPEFHDGIIVGNHLDNSLSDCLTSHAGVVAIIRRDPDFLAEPFVVPEKGDVIGCGDICTSVALNVTKAHSKLVPDFHLTSFANDRWVAKCRWGIIQLYWCC